MLVVKNKAFINAKTIFHKMFIISYNEHYNFTSSHISSIMNVKDEPYLKTQLITYMGNKRKIIHCINDVINEIPIFQSYPIGRMIGSIDLPIMPI